MHCSLKKLVSILFLSLLANICYAVPTISFGPLGDGLNDGTEPFGSAALDASGNPIPCASAAGTEISGADCGEKNRVVRTQDIASHLWSISVNGGDSSIPPGDPVLTDVVITQTLHPSTNAVVSFASLPTACTAIAGAGTNPPSSIVENPDGTSTLTCNLGPFAEGQAKIFAVPVKPSGESWNGTSYTTTQSVSSIDSSGNANATPASYVDDTPVMISALPAYDLIHSISSTQKITAGGVATVDVGQGPEKGFYAYMNIRLAADRRTGVEAITQPITIKDTFTAVSGNEAGPSYPLEFHVIDCIPNPSGWGSEVFGRANIWASRTGQQVTDSGTCDYTRDDPTDPTSTSFSVELQGADLSGNEYPTRTIGGTDLTAGPFYVINHRVKLFVPFRSIDLADGIVGNNTGAIYLSSLISDFDPSSPSGISNFGAETEPGYDGELMDDGSRSNNQLGPVELKLVARGSFSKRSLKTVNDAVTSYKYSGVGSYHAGDGEVEAGLSNAGWVYALNSGTVAFNNSIICDVFDNTVQQLTDRGNVGATPGTYAYMGSYAPSGHDYRDYIVEYANIDTSGDDPLDGNHDGINDYDSATGRYNGDWTKQRNARCEDASATNGWHTDPTQVVGGIDGVNAARALLSPAAKAAGKAMEPGQDNRFIVPLKTRDRFLGGPHDGVQIPVGTVLANFGGFKSDEYASSWTGRYYNPSPESGTTDGDRVTLTRIQLALDSHSITPYAASGGTASTVAGGQIVWQVDTALQSGLPDPGNAQNLQIINVLPPEAIYNASCTAATAGGTTAGLVQYNTDKNGNTAPGYTRLVWNLGNLKANTIIPPRIICTDTDPLVDDGTSVVNYAEIRADNVISSLAARSDTHTITLEQVGEVQLSKVVDAQLDDRNNSQIYTLGWSNFSAAIRVNAPVMIDIFPFSGDGNAPSSTYTGKLQLQGEPVTRWGDESVPSASDAFPTMGTWYYTADAPASIVLDPDSNTSNWCTEAQFATAGCPASFAEVTAIKFVSNYQLERDGNPRQSVKATMTLLPGTLADGGAGNANLPGDIYTNRFAVDSSTLPPEQFLVSPNVTVQVASYSIGDLVFADIDGDGKYDPNVDYPAPNGVTVNLYTAAGVLVDTTTIGQEMPGRYLFKLLDSGNYYVEIPASEFADNQLLELWQTSVLSTAEDDDKNEADDQHAYSTSTPAASGVRSGVITISGNAAPPGGVPTGNEPLGENVDTITDYTGDDFSNLTLDMGLIPDLYEVTGTVWNDANNNGLRENAEGGIPNVTVVMKGSPWPGAAERCLSVDTDANGFYKFESVLSGNYQLIESDASSAPFGNATCPPAASDPAGYISTTPNTRNITVYETNLTRQDFGDYGGIVIRGRVFNDNGLSAGTSANAIQDGAEPGIGGVKVIATDASGAIYDSTVTSTDGRYELHVPASAGVVNVREFNAAGYASTGAQLGNTGGNYDLASDTITFNVAPTVSYTGLDFGDIKKPAFEPDHRSEILPGNVVFYAHTFTTPTAGTVIFNHSSDLNNNTSWAETLYRDSNCDGQLNGSEGNTVLGPFNLGVPANGKLCVINKVFAPANAAANDQHKMVTTATFTYGGTGAGSVALTVTDITTVTASSASADASRLELRKSVQNITQNTAETETSNEAVPGDVLKYRLYYRNSGSGPITDMVINDTPPAYTNVRLTSASCDTTPATLNCTPAVAFDRVDWEIIGTLQGGASGSVSYEVEVEQ